MTVLKALVELVADADYIYFGDTARLPYGSKSAETVAKYALGFQVPEIHAMFSSLRAKGVPFMADPHVVNRTPTSELWLSEFTDPDGNQLGLMRDFALSAGSPGLDPK